MDTIKINSIKILGRPMPLQRPKMSKYGVYDPQKCLKKFVLSTVSKKLLGMVPISHPICVHMEFCFVYPKSISKKKNRDRDIVLYREGRPDIDNLCKFYADLFNGIIWKDDAFIVQMTAEKRYDQEDSTIIRWTNPVDFRSLFQIEETEGNMNDNDSVRSTDS